VYIFLTSLARTEPSIMVDFRLESKYDKGNQTILIYNKVMRELNLSLLGQLDITLSGKPIQVDSDKVRALLLYLAVENRRPHRRDVLAEMFWPGKPEGVARNSLKQALANLRKALGDREARSPFLLISRKETQFNRSSQHWIDANTFVDILEIIKSHDHEELSACESCPDGLTRAAALYQGEFLEELYISGAQDFNDWVVIKREAYQRQMTEALWKLSQIHEYNGEYLEACEYSRHLVELEPWNEESHRGLMHLYALNGMRSVALRQYHICRQNLSEEFGVEPSRETQALYEKIKAWETGVLPEKKITTSHYEN
jgi:DNA-binding SARP family transcriptional activator